MIGHRADAVFAAKLSDELRKIAAFAASMPVTAPRPTIPATVKPNRLAVGRLVELVAFELGLTVADLIGPCRVARLCRGRAAVCWLARVTTNRSLREIGRALGGRDHSTIAHALRHAKLLRAEDPAFHAVTSKLLCAVAELVE